MEIAGMNDIYDCAYCICASCSHGKIKPNADNTCQKGCQLCDMQHRTIAKTSCDSPNKHMRNLTE